MIPTGCQRASLMVSLCGESGGAKVSGILTTQGFRVSVLMEGT